MVSYCYILVSCIRILPCCYFVLPNVGQCDYGPFLGARLEHVGYPRKGMGFDIWGLYWGKGVKDPIQD